MFLKVITTMPAAREYIMNKEFTPLEKIEYIYGVVPQNKGSFDICFIAHKYSSKGQDKGYDTFIETAQKLAPVSKDIHFHIIGPWENTIDTSSINPNQIHFYGTKPGAFLSEFYKKADIIITANRYQMIYTGNFDGYPLGIEASLAGVYVMNTDPLNMKPKTPLKDIKGFEVITNDADKIAESIIKKLGNLEEFYKETKEQYEGALKIFDKELQLKARLDIVKQCLK